MTILQQMGRWQQLLDSSSEQPSFILCQYFMVLKNWFLSANEPHVNYIPFCGDLLVSVELEREEHSSGRFTQLCCSCHIKHPKSVRKQYWLYIFDKKTFKQVQIRLEAYYCSLSHITRPYKLKFHSPPPPICPYSSWYNDVQIVWAMNSHSWKQIVKSVVPSSQSFANH